MEANGMGCDMFIALGPACVPGVTHVAVHAHGARAEDWQLCLVPAAQHTLDQTLIFAGATVPQARHAAAVLGLQPRRAWGFSHGLNEQRVAIGTTRWHSRLPGES